MSTPWLTNFINKKPLREREKRTESKSRSKEIFWREKGVVWGRGDYLERLPLLPDPPGGSTFAPFPIRPLQAAGCSRASASLPRSRLESDRGLAGDAKPDVPAPTPATGSSSPPPLLSLTQRHSPSAAEIRRSQPASTKPCSSRAPGARPGWACGAACACVCVYGGGGAIAAARRAEGCDGKAPSQPPSTPAGAPVPLRAGEAAE